MALQIAEPFLYSSFSTGDLNKGQKFIIQLLNLQI